MTAASVAQKTGQAGGMEVIGLENTLPGCMTAWPLSALPTQPLMLADAQSFLQVCEQ